MFLSGLRLRTWPTEDPLLKFIIFLLEVFFSCFKELDAPVRRGDYEWLGEMSLGGVFLASYDCFF